MYIGLRIFKHDCTFKCILVLESLNMIVPLNEYWF